MCKEIVKERGVLSPLWVRRPVFLSLSGGRMASLPLFFDAFFRRPSSPFLIYMVS